LTDVVRSIGKRKHQTTKSSVRHRISADRFAPVLLTILLVFTQWIPILSILGRMLFQRGFKFVYLWGEMKTEQQEMSVRAFQEVPEIKIMVSPRWQATKTDSRSGPRSEDPRFADTSLPS
jgi:SNF2 family DNA or RNA helicase